MNNREFYTWHEKVDIQPNQSDTTYGTMIVEYEIRRVVDVRNLIARRAYKITCTQRLIIPNESAEEFGPNTVTRYAYPAMVTSGIALKGASDYDLADYKPKTLNSAVMSTQSGSVGNNAQASTQHTSGSATSETSSWEINVNYAMGPGAGYGHSTTQESSASDTSGASHGTDITSASSASMSIKDWAGYAAVDRRNQDLTWFWGQQYPWDVLMYHDVDPEYSDNTIELPEAVEGLLWSSETGDNDTKVRVFAPSQLSLFGVNLVAQASWICLQPDGKPDEDPTFAHDITIFTGQHGYRVKSKDDPSPSSHDETAHATLDALPKFKWSPAQPLSLARLALDPQRFQRGRGRIRPLAVHVFHRARVPHPVTGEQPAGDRQRLHPAG